MKLSFLEIYFCLEDYRDWGGGLPSDGSFPRWLLGLGQDKARSQELPPGSPCGQQGPKHVGHLPPVPPNPAAGSQSGSGTSGTQTSALIGCWQWRLQSQRLHANAGPNINFHFFYTAKNTNLKSKLYTVLVFLQWVYRSPTNFSYKKKKGKFRLALHIN